MDYFHPYRVFIRDDWNSIIIFIQSHFIKSLFQERLKMETISERKTIFGDFNSLGNRIFTQPGKIKKLIGECGIIHHQVLVGKKTLAPR